LYPEGGTRDKIREMKPSRVSIRLKRTGESNKGTVESDQKQQVNRGVERRVESRDEGGGVGELRGRGGGVAVGLDAEFVGAGRRRVIARGSAECKRWSVKGV
jgi:hypothetical protein